MLGSRIGVLCLVAAACNFASVAQETAASATGTLDILTTVATERPSETPPDVPLGDAAIALRRKAESGVLQVSDNQADASEVKTEDFAAKVLALADALPTKERRGTRTALLGLAGVMLFFALHLIAQYARYAKIDQDMLFRHDSGKLTFTGAGLIISFTLFAAGLAESLPESSKIRNAGSKFPTLARGAKRTLVGKRMLLMSALAIALAWVIGAPQFLMEAATIGFLAGGTLSALGLTLLFSDLKRAVDLAKKLHAFGIKNASPMGEDFEMDPSFLLQLVDYFTRDHKGLESFLADNEMPFAEAFLSAAAQPGSREGGKQFTIDTEHANALFDADAFAEVIQHLQEFQRQQKGAARENSQRNFVNSLMEAVKALEEHPQILQQASQLLQQLEMVPVDAAAARDTPDLVESAVAAAKQAGQQQTTQDQN